MVLVYCNIYLTRFTINLGDFFFPASKNLEEIRNESNDPQDDDTSDTKPTSSNISGRVIGALVGLVTAVVATGLAFVWGDQA